jgi:hypothetical protein
VRHHCLLKGRELLGFRGLGLRGFKVSVILLILQKRCAEGREVRDSRSETDHIMRQTCFQRLKKYGLCALRHEEGFLTSLGRNERIDV